MANRAFVVGWLGDGRGACVPRAIRVLFQTADWVGKFGDGVSRDVWDRGGWYGLGFGKAKGAKDYGEEG